MSKRMSKRLHKPLPALLTAAALVVSLTSCASLPSTSSPHVLRSFNPQAPAVPVIAPEEGREPDLLLRDFYAASAIPTSDYEAARAFMTSQASAAWDPTEETLVVDRIGVTTMPGSTPNRRSFSVHGNVVGVLGAGGMYRPERGSYEATIELQQVSGEWRVASLPAGVVLERTELRNQYQPFNLYFFDERSGELVTDRRWVFSRRETLASALISLLMQGPSTRLEPAVSTVSPTGASYLGMEDGAYGFSGFGGVNDQDRARFAAGVVWTLASAGINGPFRITADGASLISGATDLTTDDFSELSPVVQAAGESRLYSLTGGSISLVDAASTSLIDSPLSSEGTVQSVDINAAGKWAAVFAASGQPAKLRVGSFDGADTELMEAETFTRPSFESKANAVWTVADGQHIQRTVRSAATNEFTTEQIAIQMPEGISGNISVLRLSRSGARVVLVIDGRLFTGIVDRRSPGERAIVNVMEYATELGGSVVAADWQPDGSLIVGTSSSISPVLRVEQDGSSATTLSVGNISAPVVAVAATPNMLYVTDANAILQLPNAGEDNPLWREVPGLQGVRALPIVAR